MAEYDCPIVNAEFCTGTVSLLNVKSLFFSINGIVQYDKGLFVSEHENTGFR